MLVLSFLYLIGSGFLLGLPFEDETDPLFFKIEALLLETLRGLDFPRLLIVCLDNLSTSTLLLISSTFFTFYIVARNVFYFKAGAPVVE